MFNAHSYPTKIDPMAAAACILQNTRPGDLVFDGFAGSGATALGATLCGSQDPRTQELLRAAAGEVELGYRDAVLYDISPLACMISDTLINPPDPRDFELAANELLTSVESRHGWIYLAADPLGQAGAIRHVIWSEVVRCGRCGTEQTAWDLVVNLSPAAIARSGPCAECGASVALDRAERATEIYRDVFLDTLRLRRRRIPVRVYGAKGNARWEREPIAEDLARIAEIESLDPHPRVPIRRMMDSAQPKWGEMHRAGYHTGIEYVHDFYTRRNLLAVAALFEESEKAPHPLREALRFWISSYNASHSTLMSRIVCKRGVNELVLTGGQPGALYVSAFPVEKNVFAGLRKKIRTMVKAFAVARGRTNRVDVTQRSSLSVALPDRSVDYVFTDPPFAGNIQYAEVNFLSEVWLGPTTDKADETIVSSIQGKTAESYRELLTRAFVEIERILAPGGRVTVAFHSAHAEDWSSLKTAWERAGFEVSSTAVLDKVQGSFKQTTTRGAVRKDPLINLRRRTATISLTGFQPRLDVWTTVARRLAMLDGDDRPELRSRQRLYSHVITCAIEAGAPVPLDAGEFFAELSRRFPHEGEIYRLALRSAVEP